MLGLCEDAELPELLVELLHVSRDSGLDGAEVVVVKLLTLGSLGAEEGPAGELEVLALVVERPVDQEILLLGSDGGDDAGHVGPAEEVKELDRFCADSLHGAEQGGLFVEHLAGVGAGSLLMIE